MPPKRKSTTRKPVAEQKALISKPLLTETLRQRTRAQTRQFEDDHRRRTRAWTRQEKNNDKGVEADALGSKVTPATRHGQRIQLPHAVATRKVPRQEGRVKKTVNVNGRSLNRSRPSVKEPIVVSAPKSRRQVQTTSIKQPAQVSNSIIGPRHERKSKSVARVVNQAKRKSKARTPNSVTAGEEAQRVQETARPPDPSLITWLGQVESGVPNFVPRLEDNMDSSSTSRYTGENESTVKGKNGKKKVSEIKLRIRWIKLDAVEYGRIEHLKSILKTALPDRRLKDIGELQSVAQNFLEQIADYPESVCYPYIDDFSFNFDKEKSRLGCSAVNSKYFEADLQRCLMKNEAMLQRTVMIHIINQYWIGSLFDWNTEGQWCLPKDNRLPSRKADDDITQPKPDLSISFTHASFIRGVGESAAFPTELEKCISPDGVRRCFPFLFMEVKKAAADLQDAYMANLHSASQALYSIYQWMVQAGQQDEFFEKICVFSIVFNAQDLGVRVHHAVRLHDGAIEYRFTEFCPLDRYTKDQACRLIHAILYDYAAEELYPILKATFDEVVTQEDERSRSKRKASDVRSATAAAATAVATTKRLRRAQTGNGQTGQSFAMSNLSTESQSAQ